MTFFESSSRFTLLLEHDLFSENRFPLFGIMLEMGELYASESLLQVVLITGLIGGGAAWLAGRAVAHTWRPFWHVIGYMALLGCAVRFVHFALFEADLIAPLSYTADTAFLLCVGCLAWRITRTTQMVTQYSWLYERTSPVTWRDRTGKEGAPGKA